MEEGGEDLWGEQGEGEGVTWHQVRAAAVVAALVPVMVVGLLWITQGKGEKTGFCMFHLLCTFGLHN